MFWIWQRLILFKESKHVAFARKEFLLELKIIELGSHQVKITEYSLSIRSTALRQAPLGRVPTYRFYTL